MLKQDEEECEPNNLCVLEEYGHKKSQNSFWSMPFQEQESLDVYRN